MLKQLLKHEWIATARKYSLFYIVLAAVTLFTGLVSLIESENVVLTTMKGLIIGVYVITLVGMWFCSIGYAVIRFYKNMVSGEGYLTFTLPVTVPQLLISKLLVAFVWQLVTIAAILVSVFENGTAAAEYICGEIKNIKKKMKRNLAKTIDNV